MAIEWNAVTWYSKTLAVVLFVGVAVGSFLLGREYQRVVGRLIDESTAVQDITPSTKQELALVGRAKNATYEIDGRSMQLMNGISRIVQEGSSAEIETRYFGNSAKGDLNNDGKEDMVFVLTQSMGGSGTFYYAAALLSHEQGYQGSNAVLMGDRIAPQSTDIRDGKANVNYADRAINEPMTIPPSIGKTLTLIVKNGRLVKQ